jgi:Transcriptional regulators
MAPDAGGQTGRRTARARTGAEAGRIAAALRAEIVSGALPPGTALRQEVLAERHAASRMPVRDALRILAQEGFVDLAPNRGARVAVLDPAGFREICEMRVALETLAIRLAMPELTESRIDRAAQVQAEAEAGGIADFGALNALFHATLYEPCARPRLLAQIAALHDLGDRYMRIAAVELDYLARSHAEHRAILAVCRRRDAAEAADLIERHIAAAGAELLARLEAKAG